MKRRVFIATTLATCSLSACGKEYPPFFDIEWDEEVLLHDGRVIWAHIKRTFQRLNTSKQWDGIHRDTEISFDAGGKIGRFTKKFERYDVDFLHEKNGHWYIYLVSTTGAPPVPLVDWAVGFLILNPDGEMTKAKSWSQLPTEFLTRNIMPPSPDSIGIAKYNGRKLQTTEKLEHWKKNPTGAGDTPTLRRP